MKCPIPLCGEKIPRPEMYLCHPHTKLIPLAFLRKVSQARARHNRYCSIVTLAKLREAQDAAIAAVKAKL